MLASRLFILAQPLTHKRRVDSKNQNPTEPVVGANYHRLCPVLALCSHPTKEHNITTSKPYQKKRIIALTIKCTNRKHENTIEKVTLVC